MQKILILDGDCFILSSLRDLLRKRGYVVNCAQSVARADELLQSNNFDLFIAERSLPDSSSLELLEKIKERKLFLRTLLISSKKSLLDRIESLQLADDFLAKPLHLAELALKVDNLLRLRKMGDQDLLENNHFLLREDHHSSQDGYKLRPQESKILECLIRHQGMVISYETISNYVWGFKEVLPIKKTINVYIRRIRGKISKSDFQIITYKNRGYKFIDLREEEV